MSASLLFSCFVQHCCFNLVFTGSPSFLPSLRVSVHALSRVYHLSKQCGANREYFGRPPRTVRMLTRFAISSKLLSAMSIRSFQRRFNKEAYIAALPYDSRELAEQLLSTQVCLPDRGHRTHAAIMTTFYCRPSQTSSTIEYSQMQSREEPRSPRRAMCHCFRFCVMQHGR